jgi:hypothetical protein
VDVLPKVEAFSEEIVNGQKLRDMKEIVIVIVIAIITLAAKCY